MDQWPPDTAVRQEGASTVHVSGVPSPDGKEKTQEFKFDTVLGADATQEEVFDSALLLLVLQACGRHRGGKAWLSHTAAAEIYNHYYCPRVVVCRSCSDQSGRKHECQCQSATC